jgi:eukaryotic-like serine/threonine-protein kinase
MDIPTKPRGILSPRHGYSAAGMRAFALALSRNSSDVLAAVTRMETEHPEDTCIHFRYIPALRALAALNRGRPPEAINLLTVSNPYELTQTGVSFYAYYGALYPAYLRGLAYQQLHSYREATAEFQRMLEHPGLLRADPIGPAATGSRPS